MIQLTSLRISANPGRASPALPTFPPPAGAPSRSSTVTSCAAISDARFNVARIERSGIRGDVLGLSPGDEPAPGGLPVVVGPASPAGAPPRGRAGLWLLR